MTNIRHGRDSNPVLPGHNRPEWAIGAGQVSMVYMCVCASVCVSVCVCVHVETEILVCS